MIAGRHSHSFFENNRHLHHMPKRLDELKTHLGRISDLRAAAEVLEWDQETYMPDGAAEARAQQISTLREAAHTAFTSDEIGRLLEDLEGENIGDPGSNNDTDAGGATGAESGAARRGSTRTDSNSFRARLVQVTRRDYERARRLPGDLVAELARSVSRAKQAWKKAREADDFSRFAPHLERLLELTRKKADAYGYDEHPYDALLEEYEPDMRTSAVTEIFRDLRDKLVPIVETIAAQEAPDNSFLHAYYDPDQQWTFGEEVIRAFGYDFNRGRQDRSAHPFTTAFSISDVRLTTRIDANFFNPAFFGTLHEAGHGLYEQGVDMSLERTPVADGTSLGMHESQSRLWENQVGRSRAFWSHYFPKAKHRFPQALSKTELEDFYRGINRVEPSLIRVEADEVTYNLHIMLRFELEKALIEEDLDVSRLPERWNAGMEEYLGLTPPSDADGVLQDIHWSLGAFGYFPTYALGTLMSAQLFDQAEDEISGLEGQIASGSFDELRGWLRKHIHRYGRTRTADELLQATTGRSLDAESWLSYVRKKYGEIYGSLDRPTRPSPA